MAKKDEQSQHELEEELKGLTVEQKARVLRRNAMAGMSQEDMEKEKRERYLASVHGESKAARILRGEGRRKKG